MRQAFVVAAAAVVARRLKLEALIWSLQSRTPSSIAVSPD